MQRRLCFLKREVFSILCDAVHLIVKRWSRWSSRAEVQQWDTHPEPTELRLSGSLTESTWTQKIQIEFVDTKNQLADFLTKGNVTRDEWNHLRHLFIFSIFSSASCPEAMSKRMPQGQGEERELWQSRSRRWTFSRRMRQALLQRRVRVRENVRGYSVHPVSKVRISQHYVQGNLPLEVQIKMTLRRVLKCGYQMQKRTTVRKNSLLQERTRVWVFKNVQGSLPQKIPISSSTTTSSGRSTTTHLVLTFTISRKSTRICDSNLIASQKTKWKTSMCIR